MPKKPAKEKPAKAPKASLADLVIKAPKHGRIHRLETPSANNAVPGMSEIIRIEPDLDAEGYEDKVYIDRTKNKRLEGVEFHCKIEKEARGDRTYKLKSLTHYWEGTEEDFLRSFKPAK